MWGEILNPDPRPSEAQSFADDHAVDGETYRAIEESFLATQSRKEGAFRHRLLGCPDLVDGDPSADLGSAGGKKGNTWRLLLQLDSDNVPEWMFGDVGALFFFVREADLKQQRFDRVRVLFQCT